MASDLNRQSELGGYGNPGYKAGGYIYGYGDPSDPSNTSTNFSRNLTPFVAGGTIIPSQYTMTAAQSVGPAQFGINGGWTQQGIGTAQTSSPFTQTAAAPATQDPGPSATTPFLFGNNGSLGQIQGTFGNNQAGQSTPFYQQQPASQIQDQTGLGTLSPLTPQQQALIQAR